MPHEGGTFEDFEDLVRHLVQVPAGYESSVSNKIDLLERLIEQWRISRFELENGIDFEEFLVWKWFADDGRLHLAQTDETINRRRAGTPPLRLQRKLLVFLLLHHGRYKHVLDIIREFVSKIRHDLDIRDFKKTETGVFRCFTNTRFAANKLREHGLLKYTRTEAFKVWVLSLPGIVVAARALQRPGWTLPEVGDPWHGLDRFIMDSLYEVRDFPALVKRLKEICEPDVKIFESFEPVLEKAHAQLGKYWGALSNKEFSAKEREEESRRHMENLDDITGYTNFMEQLSSCIQIEDLLSKADEAAQAD